MLKMTLFTIMGMALLFLAGCRGELSPAAESHEEAPAGLLANADTGVVVETPVADIAPTEEAANYCLDCHSDKERLIDTARVEEELISESKGEG